MEKSNFTFSGTFRNLISVFTFMVFALSQNFYAQCSLGVNTNTQISLDQNCEASITPEIVLNDQTTTCPGGIFYVNVKDLNDLIIPTSPIVTGAYVNQTLKAEVVDQVSGNTGWGYIHIEDKLAPVITCVDVTVSCSDVANYQPTVLDGCDPNPTVTLLSQSEVVLTCDPDFIKTITKVYQATDNQGNVSQPCTQVITVERINLAAINFPIDLSQSNGNPIQCDVNYPVDADGHPSPSYTGVPTLFGNGIFPTTDLGCNTIVTYNDLVLPKIGGVQKIMREWIVNEWYCNGSNMITDIQIIEIVDDEGPVVSSCPSDYSVSTTPGTDCEAVILLPAITAVDACGFVAEVDVTFPGGFLNNSNGGLVSLPLGFNTIVYTFYDENQNSSQCSFEVFVEDNTAPVVVCDQNTVVSLSLDGTAVVNAHSFDDGSYDDCSAIDFAVRRMDNGVGCNFDPNFKPTVTFCCSDIGTTIVVIMRVTDANGNFNDCMVNVQVQDKLPPSIVCPANLTVDCDFAYDPNNLEASFGTATSADNCSSTITESSSINIDQCNEGTIFRTFTATDPNGSVSCTQIITFVNNDPFDEFDIVWPANVEINDCVDPSTLHPDQTGYPILTEDACDKVGFDWTDKTFTVVNGDNACFKIIRTWEVIDWCQMVNGKFLTFTHQQVIKVINTDDPVFSGDYSDKVECTYDNQCQDGFIELGASAEDACTAELVWTYRVDAFNDGTFDIISNTVVAASIDASGNYPIGNHRIVYTAEDGCGNQVSQTQFFSIVNCKAPTPYCINGLAIELMALDTDNDGEADFGMVETWASDFDAGSFHTCGLPVTVSFSADPNDTKRTYTCDDLGDNTVQIWANVILPNGMILQDFCTATLDIQANNGVCDGNTTSTLVVIDGDVENEMKEKTNDVTVVLKGSELISTTNENGVYAFPAMPMGGQYEIVPNKVEENHLNGITTLDIVLIQKHILGISTLDSPYKVIAADVNNDEKVSGLDIIGLRKLIIGVFEELPSNKDWRFVDASYNFINPSNPLQEDFNETYSIGSLSSNMNVDFVSVKVGDVNNTAAANLTSNNSAPRSFTTLDLTAENVSFNEGEKVNMVVTSTELASIYGMQYTLQFNNTNLEFVGITSDMFEVTEGVNLGMNNIDQGIISVSVSDANLVELNSNDVLFNIEFIAKRSSDLSSNVNINSDVTVTEAYDAALEVMDVELGFRNKSGEEVETSPFSVDQNVPNPFNSTTKISFNLPKSNQVVLSIFDVSGKVIYTENGTYGKGRNTITLNVSDLNTSGVLYYQIETKDYTAIRKMVVLK